MRYAFHLTGVIHFIFGWSKYNGALLTGTELLVSGNALWTHVTDAIPTASPRFLTDPLSSLNGREFPHVRAVKGDRERVYRPHQVGVVFIAWYKFGHWLRKYNKPSNTYLRKWGHYELRCICALYVRLGFRNIGTYDRLTDLTSMTTYYPTNCKTIYNVIDWNVWE